MRRMYIHTLTHIRTLAHSHSHTPSPQIQQARSAVAFVQQTRQIYTNIMAAPIAAIATATGRTRQAAEVEDDAGAVGGGVVGQGVLGHTTPTEEVSAALLGVSHEMHFCCCAQVRHAGMTHSVNSHRT